MINDPVTFMQEAIRQSRLGMEAGSGGPFGCVIVKEGKIIAAGFNEVLSSNDPTAHAEIVTIRKACSYLQSFQLTGCELYTSCEPCPMCLGAIYWARPDKIFYANTKADAAAAGFDDHFIYDELALPVEMRKLPLNHLKLPQAKEVFDDWIKRENKISY
jgi:guanine deaminase